MSRDSANSSLDHNGRNYLLFIVPIGYHFVRFFLPFAIIGSLFAAVKIQIQPDKPETVRVRNVQGDLYDP